MLANRTALGLAAILLSACASTPPASSPSAATATSDESEGPPKTAASSPGGMPTGCSEKGAKMCLPDKDFVERLCKGSFPGVALAFFAKDSPWTRGYVVKALPSASLAADEELILLRHVERPEGYDALRWDGTCASLGTNDFTQRKPASPKAASIPWRNLDEAAQSVLLADAKVKQLYEKRRKECLGATPEGGDTPCDKAEAAFTAAVAAAVRSGAQIPPPSNVP